MITLGTIRLNKWFWSVCIILFLYVYVLNGVSALFGLQIGRWGAGTFQFHVEDSLGLQVPGTFGEEAPSNTDQVSELCCQAAVGLLHVHDFCVGAQNVELAKPDHRNGSSES